MPTTSFTVNDIASLNSDIASIHVNGTNAATNTNYTITLTGNIDRAVDLQDIVAA